VTYATYEASRSLGAPIQLFEFVCGTRAFRYTDHELPVVFTGLTFAPIAIDRAKIVESGTMDTKSFSITVPHDVDIANLFLAYPPSDVTTLKIRAGHLGDPDEEFKIIWTGRVLSCSRRKTSATFTCESVATSMRRNGLKRRYQYGCPYALYSEKCGVVRAAFTVTATVEAINGSRVKLPAGWTSRDTAKYLDGIFEWTTSDGVAEVRTIKRVESGGTVLVLSYNPTGLTEGASVSVSLGCNHKAGVASQTDGDCGPLFNNIQNFGGQPWIPFKNPIGIVNNYY